MEFKAVPRTIADTLDLKRKYIIPRFQREYSWENDELQELWDDLLECLSLKEKTLYPNEYFIGTLVLVGDDDDNMNIERQVVDGQQRLMTITIAFAVLSELFKQIGEETLSNKMYSYIMGEDADGVEYAKLITETPKPYFQMRIQKKEKNLTTVPNTDEEKRILNAYNFFEKKLSEKNVLQELEKRYSGISKNIKYVDALKIFRDQILHCKVIYVTVKSFEAAYTIFEVLNAKGKDLTPIDIIKNSLFSILDETEPIDSAEISWKRIRDNMTGKCDIQTFYRHYWLSKYGYATAKKLVKEFNEKIEKNQIEYTKFLNELVEASEDYCKIAYPNKNDWTQPEDIEIFYSLEACDVFGITQVRIFLLALIDVKRKKLISHKQFLRMIKYLEYYHFVFNAICSMRPSGLERRYSSYARRLRECSDKNETKKCVDELIVTLNESLPSREVFIDNFKTVKYTSYFPKDKKLVQYILKKYEFYNMQTKEMQPLSFTIEHVMPESSHNDECSMVGNMLPLGENLNSQLMAKSFGQKMKKYAESQYCSVKNFVEKYKTNEEWTVELIEERTKLIANILYDYKEA